MGSIGQLQDLWLVLAAVLAMVGLNVLMILLTVGTKGFRSLRQSWEEKYVRRTEPHLDTYLVTGQLPPELRRWQPRHRDLLAALIIAHLALVRGSDRDQLALLVGKLRLTDAYLELLGSRRWWRRARAAENLGYFGGPGAVGVLTRRLSDEDETVRAVAARALARIGTPDAAEALALTLGNPSELTSLRVAENLERLGAVALPPLLPVLRTGSDRARVLAAQIVGNLRAAEARPALLEAVRSGRHEDLRAQATLALGKIGDPDDLPTILRSSCDNAWPVRAQAANALGMIGEVLTIPALKELAADSEWWVRANAGRALARIGSAGESALVELLTATDDFARDRGAATLESQGITRRVTGELAGVDVSGKRARAIIRAVVAIGATRYLTRLAESMTDGPHRQMLKAILDDAAPEAERSRLQEDVPVGTE